ncbi:4-diphosphocytidyl-2-C-methyl-D-erythritol kinase [Oligella sp. MSHR50489EDL]|uniref:4-(cytidine 5'-diphospho)-2-C-methyl-D-erythritol kinase n=1 Tax=Oligella sp. MSHR50489EDL TaxID=3139409 RepID=UPI003D8151BF
MTVLSIKAPAKLNLFLHVTGRREDGYHLLQSLFVPIALYDGLNLKLNSRGGQIRRLTENHGIAEDDDLVIKAARLLKSTVGRSELGVDIELEKVIPSGAGLGGGSSDAAAVLLALNQLWELQLSPQELLPLALQLGADVPFFLYKRAAIVEGIGERITPLRQDLNARVAGAHYVLFVPKLPIPTVNIFKDPGLKRDTPSLELPQLEEALFASEPLWHYGHNDLEPVACAQHPALAAMVQWLTALGIKVRMSGAGSVFFAVFESRQQSEAVAALAEQAYAELTQHTDVATALLRSLDLRCVVVGAA